MAFFDIIVNEHITNRYSVEAETAEEASQIWTNLDSLEPDEEVCHTYNVTEVTEL